MDTARYDCIHMTLGKCDKPWCRCLKEVVCAKGKICRFYKAAEEEKRSREKCEERIKRLVSAGKMSAEVDPQRGYRYVLQK